MFTWRVCYALLKDNTKYYYTKADIGYVLKNIGLRDVPLESTLMLSTVNTIAPPANNSLPINAVSEIAPVTKRPRINIIRDDIAISISPAIDSLPENTGIAASPTVTTPLINNTIPTRRPPVGRDRTIQRHPPVIIIRDDMPATTPHQHSVTSTAEVNNAEMKTQHPDQARFQYCVTQVTQVTSFNIVSENNSARA